MGLTEQPKSTHRAIALRSSQPILHGDLIVKARPIGGFRMIDGGEANDKIIAVLENDETYSDTQELAEHLG